jgi:hypothetical protein
MEPTRPWWDCTLLIQALSTDEKKALYVLNILFEVEFARREYLMDIAEDPSFKEIS